MQVSHKAVVGTAKIPFLNTGRRRHDVQAGLNNTRAAEGSCMLGKNGECIVSAQEAVYVIV